MDDLAWKIAKETQNCSISLPSLKEYLSLLEGQKRKYSDFSFLGNGASSIILKAKIDGEQEVVLKIIEWKNDIAKIEVMQNGFQILNQIPFSGYFLAVHEQFSLFYDRNQNLSTRAKPNSNLGCQSFFVQEMELVEKCSRLSDMLQSFKINKKSLSEREKEMLAIQMIDSVNLLHQKQIAHRNIRADSFLVSQKNGFQIKLKLCSLKNENSTVNLINSNENSQTYIQTLDQIPSVDIKQPVNFYIEQDLISLGLIFLQLDNIDTFDLSTITNNNYLSEFKEGILFKKHDINRNSLLYKIAYGFLSKSNAHLTCARSMLLLLLEKSDEYLKIPLFSIVLRAQVKLSTYSFPHLERKQNQEYQKDVQTIQRNQSISQYISTADRQYLSSELIKNALQIMLDREDFEDGYDILGAGANGVVFGVKNIKEKRDSVLKLCLCPNKTETLRQINIMKICQTPYIVKFFGFHFFEDNHNNQFVIFELERCKYSLQTHLELQRIAGEYSSEQKYIFGVQILDAVNFLHQNNIIHRNINLEDFLIKVNEQGVESVKLSGFSHVAQILNFFTDQEELEYEINEEFQYQSPFNCILQKYNMESLRYFAPERQEYPFATIFSTDSFSVGLCLLFLDNYFNFSESQDTQQDNQLSQPFFNLAILKATSENKMSKIYYIAEKLLKYFPQLRISIKDLIDQEEQGQTQTVCPLYSKISQNQSQDSLHQQNVSLKMNNTQCLECLISKPQLFPLKYHTNLLSLSFDIKNNPIEPTVEDYFLTPLNFLVNLTTISINFSNCSIRATNTKTLLTPFTELVNLTTISLNINSNQIGNDGTQILLLPLENIKNLSSLSLCLFDNSIGDIGAQNLLTPLKNLINLQNLYLSLGHNQIGDKGAQYLLAPIQQLINISSIYLDLSLNKINQEGAQNLLSPITNLTNLTNLYLDLNGNSIGTTGAQFLLSPICKLFNLSTFSLKIAQNSIKAVGVQNLLTPLAELPNLSNIYLDLFGNVIGLIGEYYLLVSFINLLKIQNISVYFLKNSSSKSIEYICEKYCKNLKYFRFLG